MPAPRYLFLSTAGPAVRAAGAVRPVQDVLWRLVAGNNRPLGRAAGPLETVDLCRAAVLALARDLPDLRAVPDLARPAGRWAWQLVRPDGVVAAVSGRSYERERDMWASLAQFVAAAPEAVVTAGVALRRQSLLRGAGGRPLP